MGQILKRVQRVRAQRSTVTDFFERPENLQALTPPFLGFRITTPPPIEMKVGALIDYTITLHGVPMRWRTFIEEYVPGERFVDVQIKGPYAHWHHTHSFVEVPGGTEIRDVVDYALPLGPLGTIAHALFVRRQLDAIFDYRRKVVEEKFGSLGLTPITEAARP